MPKTKTQPNTQEVSTNKVETSNVVPISDLNFLIVEKSKILESSDLNLSASRYRVTTDYTNAKWLMVKIKDLCNMGRGRVISKITMEENPGEYPVYSSQTSNDGCFGFLGTYDFEGEYVTWTTDGANAGTVFHRSGKFNCTNVCGTLKIKSGVSINMRFLSLVLNSVAYKHVIQVGNPKLMNNVMGEIEIPLPPLSIQEEIVKEIEQYQKIIENKKQEILYSESEIKNVVQNIWS